MPEAAISRPASATAVRGVIAIRFNHRGHWEHRGSSKRLSSCAENVGERSESTAGRRTPGLLQLRRLTAAFSWRPLHRENAFMLHRDVKLREVLRLRSAFAGANALLRSG